MASEYLQRALGRLEDQQNFAALNLLKKTEYQASEGIHLATSFQSVLRCVQMQLISGTLIESATEISGLATTKNIGPKLKIF